MFMHQKGSDNQRLSEHLERPHVKGLPYILCHRAAAGEFTVGSRVTS